MKRAYFVWASVLCASVAALLLGAAPPEIREALLAVAQSFLTRDTLAVLGAAFACEYVDATLGMGYGTTLTPILLLFGHGPLEIVPAVLLSQLLAGTTSSFLHHGAGNVDFRRGSRDRKIALLLAAASIGGTILATSVALQLPAHALRVAIGVVIVGVGIAILATVRRTLRFSRARIATLGAVAAFNKGISGGGYGPIVTGGQLLAGVDARGAIGITSLAEGLTCMVGFGIYALTVGIDARLAMPLVVGSMLSVPMAVLSVKALPKRGLRIAVGLMTLLLGAVALIEAF